MHFFSYKGKDFFAEDVPISKVVKEVGTPVYIYSKKTLVRHFNAFSRAFTKIPHLICYSVKANSNIALLDVFAKEGGGFDIVSGGELFRALRVGADPGKIVFSGVGKRDDEIEFALRSSIFMFNVESPSELRTIDSIAKRLGKKAAIAIRVNPDVDPRTHPYISTGLKRNKFGIEIKTAVKEYLFAKARLKNLELIGVDCHIGSQITEISPFADALKKTTALVKKLRKEGIAIKYLDMGGGLGITYKEEAPPHPSRYGSAVIEGTRGLDLTLIFEPGRAIVGNAGILAMRVLYTKSGTKKDFVIVDAGMNDLARPSLYGSYHAIKTVKKPSSKKEIVADIVGPICESGDFMAKDREMPIVKRGDALCVMSAGAYGFSMSSNYNSRPRAAEVMVDGSSFSVIRERETYEDLIRAEAIIR
ncbi:MAG: diaminopimelate decarboxylase [Deltaproteobacteria bacterium]|nr:diaminopimelate decarboxylase [Deltaproteobacteria bacterium]